MYVAASEIFNVEEWRDLENRVSVRSRSLQPVLFKSLGAVSYSPSIVTWRCLVSFARHSDLLVENREIFIPTCI